MERRAIGSNLNSGRLYRGANATAKAFRGRRQPLDSRQTGAEMPDTIRFLLVVFLLGGAIYGGAWALAHFPPEQTEIVKSISNERIRPK